eukprot:10349544-Alexandrium_andersonii.AAC.1
MAPGVVERRNHSRCEVGHAAGGLALTEGLDFVDHLQRCPLKGGVSLMLCCRRLKLRQLRSSGVSSFSKIMGVVRIKR